MKVLYINSVSQHQLYDACFLQCVAQTADTVECYFSQKDQEYAVKMNAKYGITNVKMRSIKVFHPKSNVQVGFQMILSAIQNLRFFLLHRNVDYIVYCYNNPLFLPLLYWGSKLIKNKVLISCHGELESLIKDSTGCWSRISKYLLTKYLIAKDIPCNIKFTVLGQSILDNLLPILPNSNRGKFYTINHPNFFEHIESKKYLGPKMRFGVVGILTLVKGLEDFRYIVGKLHQKVDLEVVGRVECYKDELRAMGVKINDHYLSREEFEYRVSQLDAVLFFYPSDTYRLIASAALLDTMKFYKPVISYENDFFKYVKKESNYPITFVKSADEMINTILGFSVNDSNLMAKSISKFSVNFCSSQLENIFAIG